jgi:Tfp pilus assembly PilM family ATPase
MASLVGDSFFGLDLSKLKAQFSQWRRRVSKRILLIEFGISSVNLAEVRVQNDVINLDHIRRYPLPEEALERGIPTDPAQMAALIKAHCRQEDIPAHRAAVVIPPDAVFTTLVHLPAEVDPNQALAYALDPASAVQVPIQLDQTDAALIPLELPQSNAMTRSYFLSAVPQKLVDRLIETINLADLELLRLQMGTISQLNQLTDQLANLAASEFLLHVELLRECSQVSVVCRSGPLKMSRLTAIREFPEPEEHPGAIPGEGGMASEREIVASDRYLPLSELDLRRFVLELKQLMVQCQEQFPWLHWREVVLAGPNSAHPMLVNLLHEALDLPVEVSRPLAASGVGTVQLKQPILMQRLGRLVGLALSFLDVQPANSAVDALLTPPEAILPVALEDAVAQAVEYALVEADEVILEQLEVNEPSIALSLLADDEEQPGGLDSVVPSPQESALALALDNAVEEPVFSFASEQTNAESDLELMQESTTVLDSPVKISESLAMDGSPFSMGELFNSYQAKKGEQPQQTLPDAVVEEAYLIDDPSLWPSVAKGLVTDESD